MGCEVLAERGGFEPPVELMTLRRFSKPLLSTTQPPLLGRYFGRVLASYHSSGAERIIHKFNRLRRLEKAKPILGELRAIMCSDVPFLRLNGASDHDRILMFFPRRYPNSA